MLKIYTANIKYNKIDRLDVTRKSGCLLAPKWDLIMRYKKGLIPENIFKKYYWEQLENTFNQYYDIYDNLLRLPRITLVCYCKPFEFCHRIILAEFIEYKFHDKAKYIMERKRYLCK